MQTAWIIRSAADEIPAKNGVIVFAAGWAGSDELVRRRPLPEGYDFLCLYDYRKIGRASCRERV